MGGDQGHDALGGGQLAVDEIGGERPGLKASAIAIPAEPMRASGLRPIRSTKTIAITVPMMLMIEVVKE